MRKKRTIGIYCIENTVNNKKYIGQSVCVEDRWCKHINELKNNRHDNKYLQSDWNLYSINSFKFYVLEECSKEQLNEKESYYISYYHTENESLGYNLTNGGLQGFKMCERSLGTLSQSIKKSYTDDLKERRKIDALNQWNNPEIKSKITGVNNGMYGKTHTAEARKKIADAQRGRVSWRRKLIPVLCVELNKIYSSGADACKELGLNNSANIYQVCDGIRKTCGGYTWKYVKNN